MKRNIAIIVYLTFNLVVYSQKNDFDKVFLKDGKAIKGIVIEQIPFKTMTIVTSKRDTIMLLIDDIETITRKSFMRNQSLFNLQQGSIQLILESGFTISLTDDYSTLLKLNLLGLYRIDDKISAGIGTGLRYHLKGNQAYVEDIDFSPLFNDFGVPVFLDFRTTFSKRRVTGFAAIDLGYSFDLSDDPVNGIHYFKTGIFPSTHIAGAGFLVCPTFGIAFGTSGKSAINLGLAFETHFYRKYWEYSFVENSPSVSAGLVVGFRF